MKKCEEVNLEFHGGGEPTQNWLLFKKALIYFKEQSQFNGLLPKINLSTNGVLSQKQIEWIAEHISSLQISLDGTKEIQDYQRPMINGGSSFEIVCNTTRFLLEKKVEVIIRSTVTGLGIDKIPEIVKFLLSTFHGVKIHLEPVSECGRGLQTGQKFPSPKLFIEGFKNAEKIADVFGSEISYSGSSSNLTGFRQSFCGVSVPNFIVTPAGVVTACHEVAEKTHSLAENFIYGYFDTQDEKFVFDYDKIKKLKNYASNVSPICTECLALYYCAGECLAKRMESNEKINPRCKINQELMRHYVLKKFFGKEVSK